MIYSVLSEPIIPVLMPNGEEKNVGIREAFLNAHHIRDIAGNNPLERYALLRLLIAFAMDMLHPETSYDRRDLLDAGQFDERVFDQYVQECEKDEPRFDLFDPVHPFLQSRYDEAMDEKAQKPAAVLMHAIPSGNNHVFIDHRMADSHHLNIPEAFRALCASYVFCVSGTAGPSSVNNTPPLFAVMVRDNLFETIMVNMVSEQEAAPLPYGVGETAWRQNRVIVPKEQVAAVSLLEGLTWMPRRITLIYDENSNSVCKVYCQAGLNFKGNDLWNDPHVPSFRKKDNTFGTVKPELGRDVWRDAGSLLYDHDSRYVRQPLVVRCLTNIFDEDEIPEWIMIRTDGLITNQAAYTGWCESELSLPALFLYDEEKAELLRNDINMVETVQSQIYRNVQKYVDKPRISSANENHETAYQCRQFFLKAAHDLVFGENVKQILECVSPNEHETYFGNALKSIIKEMFRQILYTSGNGTDSIIRQIEAEKWIWLGMNKLIKERNDENAGL